MEVQPQLIKSRLFIGQRRYRDAEGALRQVLAADPDNVDALVLLAECQLQLNREAEGLATIERALRLEPADDELLYFHARMLLANQREREALTQIQTAISYHPLRADYFGVAAMIHLQMKQYQQALLEAERGLALDADNDYCLNARAQALIKLKRPDEAYATIATSLEQDPENSYTHANLGWSKLENGRHREALEHLREALRLDPNNDYAKAGMVEAMKARNPVYRLFLRYSFWLSRQSARSQWAFIIGLYILVQVLENVAVRVPALSPFLTPFIYLYLVAALSTWFIKPLSNLFLLINPYARYALSSRERSSALLVGGTLLLSILSLTAFLLTGLEVLMYTAFFFFAMVMPFASMLNPAGPKARRTLVIYSLALAATGVLGLFSMWVDPGTGLGLFGILFIGGLFVYQIVANTKMAARY